MKAVKRMKMILVGIIAILFSAFFFQPVQAASAKVEVRIENSDKTEATGTVVADTFLEAIQKLGTDTNTEIIVSAGTKNLKEIFSVNGRKNKEISTDAQWMGYIIRKGLVVNESSILQKSLLTGDEVVLYYGTSATKPIGVLKETVGDGTITLTANYKYVSWINKNGTPSAQNVIQPVKGVNIHLKTPDGLEQIITTDKEGKAVFQTPKIGYYTYYAEGYEKDTVPSIVRTKEKKILVGIADSTAITRGEFAALLSYKMNFIMPQNPVTVEFTDIKDSPYEKEIKTVVANGMLSGYSNGTFQPERKISLLEAAVVLSRFYDSTEIESMHIDGVPQWAQKSILLARRQGLLNGITEDYKGNVSADMVSTMMDKIKN